MTRKTLLSLVIGGLSLLALSACGGGEGSDVKETTTGEQTAELSVLETIAEAEHRGEFRDRNGARHPVETLEFFGLAPGMHVVEVWPGGGWYTSILAPYAAQTGGTYTAALFPETSERAIQRNNDFMARFGDPAIYGAINRAQFGPDAPSIFDGEGQADLVVTFRNVHSVMRSGAEKKAFADMYAALKPGGILGVVQHRLPATREQDPQARTGYVQQDYVILLAEEAGFEFVSASEVNANPADTADHPFGVWTLPPNLRNAERGQEPAPDFDSAKYEAIGESDRMTLKFRKPE